MRKIHILWVDDEIDMLKPHILFLEKKNYIIDTVNNGYEGIEKLTQQTYDIIFLDENMPGLSGIETLLKMKEIRTEVPIIMITKSEEEQIMEQAIGAQIQDYLIKPVNPNQILLALKKNIDHSRLVSESTISTYQKSFQQLGMQINDCRDSEDWKEVYHKLTYWELEIQKNKVEGVNEILEMQKASANEAFAKFIMKNYKNWFSGDSNKPLMIHNVIKEKVLPVTDETKTLLLVIDNLRYDQYWILKPLLTEFYEIESEELIYSILPTSTQYARNALFAGLMPSEIQKKYPKLWLNDDEEGGKNLHEKELLENLLKRYGKKYNLMYEKVTREDSNNQISDKINQIKSNNLSVVVYNFIDMLSHARTELEMIKALTPDAAAYRSLTYSWFEHSNIYNLIKELSNTDIKLIITTDHGSIKINNAKKVIGDKNTTTNLRYKQGKNLNYNNKDVFEITNPKEVYLPSSNLTSKYIFACGQDFLAYPNNYNYYVSYYKNTFQHGGVSLNELLIPFVVLKPKND